MNTKGVRAQPKSKITLKADPAFFQALEKMANDSGLCFPKAVDRFASELLEVAIINAYEKRYNRTISGNLCPVEVITPEESESEENQNEENENE